VGRRSDVQRRLAARREREGRLPTPAEVWSERLDRALDALGADGDRLEREWAHVILYETATNIEQDLVGEFGHRTWQPHPYFGQEEKARARQREATIELGEKVGIGPPPDDFFGC
jgi:hypothetical protein